MYASKVSSQHSNAIVWTGNFKILAYISSSSSSSDSSLVLLFSSSESSFLLESVLEHLEEQEDSLSFCSFVFTFFSLCYLLLEFEYIQFLNYYL